MPSFVSLYVPIVYNPLNHCGNYSKSHDIQHLQDKMLAIIIFQILELTCNV